jgi:Zn-dependent M32 family carboxypeptidase
MKKITINVVEIAKDKYNVRYSDGQLVYDAIVKAFNEGLQVKLLFKNVDFVISIFLNSVIEQLCNLYTDEVIKNNLYIEEIKEFNIEILKIAELTPRISLY